MDIQAIQQGLSNAASGITGPTWALLCFPALPDAIDPPTFAPTEVEGDYHQTFSATGGLTQTTFGCGIFTSRGDTEEGRKLLAAFLSSTGDSSIRAALEADKTLGGAAKTLIVQRFRGAYRLYQIGGVDYLGATLDVRVWA